MNINFLCSLKARFLIKICINLVQTFQLMLKKLHVQLQLKMFNTVRVSFITPPPELCSVQDLKRLFYQLQYCRHTLQ